MVCCGVVVVGRVLMWVSSIVVLFVFLCVRVVVISVCVVVCRFGLWWVSIEFIRIVFRCL